MEQGVGYQWWRREGQNTRVRLVSIGVRWGVRGERSADTCGGLRGADRRSSNSVSASGARGPQMDRRRFAGANEEPSGRTKGMVAVVTNVAGEAACKRVAKSSV